MVCKRIIGENNVLHQITPEMTFILLSIVTMGLVALLLKTVMAIIDAFAKLLEVGARVVFVLLVIGMAIFPDGTGKVVYSIFQGGSWIVQKMGEISY